MIEIKFDTSELLDQADNLAKLDAEALSAIRTDVVNVVALRVREKSIRQTVADLNLSRDYVESRIDRRPAGRKIALAQVVSEIRGTTLQRFGAALDTKPVNWSNAKIEGMGKKFGKWPGWTRRTGDASRNIDEDNKSDGVSVDVNRKGLKKLSTAFTMPLKNNNGEGVFRREFGVIKHLYGPSVYQTFRRYISTNEQEIATDLQDEFMVRLDEKLRAIA